MSKGLSLSKFLSPARGFLILVLFITAPAQSTATLSGRVVDQNGASIIGAKVSVTNEATGASRSGETDRDGNYVIAALTVGSYRMDVQATGFQTQLIESVSIEVSRLIV